MEPTKILRRFTIVTPIAFLLSFLVYFFLDKFIGGAFLAGSTLVLIMGIIYYYKIKRNDPIGATKSMGILFILMGIALLLLGIVALIFGENTSDALYGIIIGLLSLIAGIFSIKKKQGQKTTWKEIPRGFKAIIIFLIIRIVLDVRDLSGPSFFFGLIVKQSLSIVLNLTYILIPTVILFLLYQKLGWKLILWLQGFTIINFLASSIRIMITPLSELFALTGQKAPATITQQTELLAKSFMLVPMLIGLVIGIIIWIYIFKKKDYFQNQPNINQPYPKAT